MPALAVRPARVVPASPAGRAAALRRLALRDFRNLARVRLELDPGRPCVVLTGENGAGKTNALEAVSLLAPGRGLRRARLAELDRAGGDGPWAAAATLDSARGPLSVEMGRDPGCDRRTVAVDGRPLKGTAELGAHLGVLWLTPAQDRLFQEGPAARRRFVDRLVLGLDPAHAARLSAYERALRERALLLRGSGRRDPAWLAALERRAAELAVAVAAARLDLVVDLDVALARDPGPFPRPRLAARGEVEGWLAEMPALEAEDRLARLLALSRETDALTGGAAHGPHRSDLDVADAATGAPARELSTGRQKALLLAIVLAEAGLRLGRLGELPVLLLDEAAAHLDARRRAQLLEALAASGAQAWLTGTDAPTFAPLGASAQRFHVTDGSLEPR